jgi:hypothetical protein
MKRCLLPLWTPLGWLLNAFLSQYAPPPQTFQECTRTGRQCGDHALQQTRLDMLTDKGATTC